MKVNIYISPKKLLYLILPVLIAFIFLFLFAQDLVEGLEKRFLLYKSIIIANINFDIPNVQFIENKPPNKNLWIKTIFDAFILVPFRKNLNKGSLPPPIRKKLTIPKVDRKKQPPPIYHISMVYIGANKKFVVINNRLLMEGDFVSDKEYIVLIKNDGVLLDGAWGRRWLKIK
ncbi:hypothetical protein [Hydrogenivirga sp. 128-5-R1-1]|uniref:hypothetical protein n=1 Tax=Hydrogenivirga sp. 128-5-R1-1 TaxID=392423 RepID=UPI00015F29EF|nr:hypothetical protein [Hydrogenivirga sp. 128-5-R1-1]EDP73298.1 hypothetical protein HG1285_10732 [Hydrogenivirga sp. 128-5-R1-1]